MCEEDLKRILYLHPEMIEPGLVVLAEEFPVHAEEWGVVHTCSRNSRNMSEER